MIKAIVEGSGLKLTEPLPIHWREGQEVMIEPLENEQTLDDFERDFAVLESMCAANDPADDERRQQFLNEARRLSKEQMRKSMGLG